MFAFLGISEQQECQAIAEAYPVATKLAQHDKATD
jgi:hypothetical protein